MAVPEDILGHPDFGELVWIADQDRWFAEYRLPSGRLLDVFVEPCGTDPLAFVATAGRLLHPAVAAQPRVLGEAIEGRVLGRLSEWGSRATADELADQLTWDCLIIEAAQFPLVYIYRGTDPELFGGRDLHVYADPELRVRDVGYYRPGPPAW